jgi:DNA-binding response OmpR family regulator
MFSAASAVMTHILVVEGDAVLCGGIALTLQEHTRQFTQCHNIESAKSAFADQAFDLIILDI